MAITYFGRTAVPADGAAATNATTTITFTPPGSMQAGDLVIVTLQQRGTATFSNTTSGGQTWNALTRRTGTNIAVQQFWCIFNGTWGTNPIFTFSAGTCTSGVMNVFRPSGTGYKLAVDQAETSGTFVAGTTPFTKTITGITNARTSSVTLAAWYTADDNTWGSIAGAGWVVTGDAQYRNTASTDQSMTFAHQLLSAAGATGNVSKNQATLGGDAGITTIVSFYEYQEVTVPLLVNSGGTPTAPVVDAVATATSTAGVSAPTINGVAANNLLVLSIAQESDTGAPNVTSVVSSPSLTWTKRVDAEAASSGNAEIWTAIFAAGGNITVTVTWSLSSEVRTTLYSISNYNSSLNAAGQTATAQTAPSVNITTSEANGLILAVTSDFAAVDGASRAYRDSATERYYQFVSTKFTAYHYTKAAAMAATYTEGLTAPSTMAAGTSLYVVKGASGAGDTMFAPTVSQGELVEGNADAAGTSAASSTIEGTLNGALSSDGTSAAAATIEGTGNMTAESAGTSAASSSIETIIDGIAAAAGTSFASASFNITLDIIVDSTGTSAASATITGTVSGLADSAGTSFATSELRAISDITVTAAGTSDAAASINSINNFSGLSEGTSAASAIIESIGNITVDSAGTSTASAIGELITEVALLSSGTSNASAIIEAIGNIIVQSIGTSAASAIIESTSLVSGNADSAGTSAASAVIQGMVSGAASSSATSTATAIITGTLNGIYLSIGTSQCMVIIPQGVVSLKSIVAVRHLQTSISEKSKLKLSINHNTYLDEHIQ